MSSLLYKLERGEHPFTRALNMSISVINCFHLTITTHDNMLS